MDSSSFTTEAQFLGALDTLQKQLIVKKNEITKLEQEFHAFHHKIKPGDRLRWKGEEWLVVRFGPTAPLCSKVTFAGHMSQRPRYLHGFKKEEAEMIVAEESLL
jgi:hypothetical protein